MAIDTAQKSTTILAEFICPLFTVLRLTLPPTTTACDAPKCQEIMFPAVDRKAPQDVDAIDRFMVDDSSSPRAASTLLLRILFEDPHWDWSFRMGVTTAVAIQSYRGTDNNQD